ncbi:MAG TPA: polysaccharide deacetylase family protein [Novosphingobium sp.]
MRPFLFTIAVISLVLGTPAAAKSGQVALTFDDLPGLTVFDDQAWTDYFNERLLAGLKRHRFPAIGFVNAGKLDDGIRARQMENLKRWLAAGMDLGNHTFSHDSPNEIGAERYIADIARGEPVLRELLAKRGRPLRWFRHPYLETGSPEATRQAIDTWLAGHGYRVAPVTIDANDWEFAEPYEQALARHEERRVAEIREQYLAYTERTIAWYQKASEVLFGRQIAFVMLLHDTRLNADCLDELAAILARRDLKPVSLDRAMRDPAYRTPDHYTGSDGIDWMERWSRTLGKPLPWSDWRDPPADIVAAYDRVNNDRH